MLIASGITTSRISFSFGSFAWWPFRRWVRRRNDAIERSRTSSALSAVTSVRRPRCFCGDGFAVGLGATTGRPGAPRRTWRGPSSSSEISAAMPGARATGMAGRAAAGAAFGFAKTLLGFKFGLALGFLVVTMALFLGLAAGFGRFAFGLLDAFPAGAALGFFFRNTALFDIAQLGVGQRIGARRTLVLCEGAQDYAGIAARRRRRGGGTSRRCRGRRFGWLGYNRFGRVRLSGTIPADPALAALLHHALLGPAVAEALAHGSGLDPRLERQGLGRHTERLVARRFRINHSAVLILSSRARSHGL